MSSSNWTRSTLDLYSRLLPTACLCLKTVYGLVERLGEFMSLLYSCYDFWFWQLLSVSNDLTQVDYFQNSSQAGLSPQSPTKTFRIWWDLALTIDLQHRIKLHNSSLRNNLISSNRNMSRLESNLMGNVLKSRSSLIRAWNAASR